MPVSACGAVSPKLSTQVGQADGRWFYVVDHPHGADQVFELPAFYQEV
jgi:hypothetical protein